VCFDKGHLTTFRYQLFSNWNKNCEYCYCSKWRCIYWFSQSWDGCLLWSEPLARLQYISLNSGTSQAEEGVHLRNWNYMSFNHYRQACLYQPGI